MRTRIIFFLMDISSVTVIISFIARFSQACSYIRKIKSLLLWAREYYLHLEDENLCLCKIDMKSVAQPGARTRTLVSQSTWMTVCFILGILHFFQHTWLLCIKSNMFSLEQGLSITFFFFFFSRKSTDL